MLGNLGFLDYAVILGYLAAMLGLGVAWSRQRKTDDEYFLAGRSMPWFAVGVSVIASLLSSLTYLAEPGEVWESGATNMVGKMLAIPLELVVVWLFCVPFMMSFRYTSAYEYLGDRFGKATRWVGVGMFLCLAVLWMGFVVLASAKALAIVSGVPLWLVIVTIGFVATMYTMLGGLRAVIWTDVVQVAILIGGGFMAISYVAWSTGTWLPDWYAATSEHLLRNNIKPMPLITFDPTVRATVATVALNMTVWHICTHLANQMTVQRYFSTHDPKSARRSFLTATLFGVGINVMLLVVGMAMLFYYQGQQPMTEVDGKTTILNPDLIFPTFAVAALPAGCGGAILAALLAAAMSSIDSGVNSIATVLSVEMRLHEQEKGKKAASLDQHHVKLAMTITLLAGIFITAAAYGLTFLPDDWGIVAAMPRTFNAFTGPLGGLFMVGMFLPFVGQRGVIAGVACGLATSLGLGYSEQIQQQLVNFQLLEQIQGVVSFHLVMPTALAVTVGASALFGGLLRDSVRPMAGLTWYTRRKPGDKDQAKRG
ncbi:sodium:solute symporter family transporter [Lignipirellula cremea]|uniref:Sodium/glucose cotransporter n=1 Tax=Lignipirellula cremea TaxID=2528010 RepID=A0A518DTN7_9BACT|nr:sodium/solute symporter [Lignipirellula cremea]QDU95206.1 Sodium/glucose cotransporter [Lignipirellula cremea]